MNREQTSCRNIMSVRKTDALNIGIVNYGNYEIHYVRNLARK